MNGKWRACFEQARFFLGGLVLSRPNHAIIIPSAFFSWPFDVFSIK
jgi:hypothetical protein